MSGFKIPSVNTLIATYKCKMQTKDLLALTPQALDLMPEETYLVDLYGSRKTKAQFKQDRKGKLYESSTGGVTIFCLEV